MAEISKIQPIGSSTQYDLSALKIKINDTAAPSSTTAYRIICCNANSGYAETSTTSSFKLHRNSTSNFVVIGDSTIQGGITLHKGNGKYIDIVLPESLTANKTIAFPDAGGIICLTNGTGASGTWGISITGNAATSSSCTGNAATATKCGDGTCYGYFHHSNELNFGGSNTSTTIFFGYRAMDSRAIPTNFIFGGSTGTATI